MIASEHMIIEHGDLRATLSDHPDGVLVSFSRRSFVKNGRALAQVTVPIVAAVVDAPFHFVCDTIHDFLPTYTGKIGLIHELTGYWLKQHACRQCGVFVRPEGGHLCETCGRNI